ncbi:glycosyltransferase family 4 protein [Peribacillus simplex]|uniref:glycosyltransferase family 4 protein n=1 Tax=Peribacillus simplex TaxID=1478 RepID=UPI001922F05C|nr:glycosyltransferase family 4 protein [Peribacillus simplex]MBD8589476.1 glycosyltransferase family 4 protein [Peribacillus simplex]
MRIVCIRSNPVAPYPRLEKMVNSLAKNGHNVHVLAWDRSQKYNCKSSLLNLTDSKVPITRFGIPGKFGGGFKQNAYSLLKFQIKIFLWLFKNRNSYDVIHAYDFDTGYTALKCAKLFKKKLVYDIPDYYIDSHGLKGSNIGEYVQKSENNIINKADAVIICTEKRKEQIAGTNPRRLVIIHNSPVSIQIQEELTTETLNENNNKLKIVYVGILAHSRFIKEIADIVIKRRDCEFHIGGFGELENYFRELSIENDNIYFYGKIPYNETIELEKKCDVITAIYDPRVPNHYYAAPNKFYEALMLGKPLIMAKDTGLDEVVKINEIGEIIDYSVESLNEAIELLNNNRDKWKLISQKAKALYMKNYSWEIMEKRIVDLYENL